ncbi:MAG: hypothetical protein ACI875_001799, partial [Planctomycetota bacterium]
MGSILFSFTRKQRNKCFWINQEDKLNFSSLGRTLSTATFLPPC